MAGSRRRRRWRGVFEYQATTKWCGWWGGWGSEADIAAVINGMASQGWRLASSKNLLALWFWVVPRPKLLMIFERARA
jgi:hypothetical protein